MLIKELPCRKAALIKFNQALWSKTINTQERLMTVFRSVFGDVADGMSEDDGPGSVDAWDSVTHLNLILAIEAEFGVQFDTAEIPDLLSLGRIRSRLEN